jgi:hypothetical protein
MTEKAETLKVYFNARQLESMAIAANTEYIIASRGFGKSEGIDAPRLLRNVFAMPRSAGALLSPTYGKLLRNTLPAIFHALDRLGYKRGLHYVVGRKPPKELNFQKPYIDPFDYSYVIAWFNGSIQHLISFDRPMSANSMSLDYVMGFEAKFLDFDKIKAEVLPANRGNINYFGHCPWHHGQLYTTDMPMNKGGMWILDKEKEMDAELIELIKALYAEYIHAKKNNKNKYLHNSLKKELNFFRSKATYYAEYDVFENIELLGESYVAQMKRDLPPLIFRSAILNKRFKKIENGFYSALNERIHCYEGYPPSDPGPIDEYLNRKHEDDCRNDGDIDHTKPLIIANDYNAAINSIVTGQVIDHELRTLRSSFVKTPRKLKEVVEDWCDYYHYHPGREVIYYYDSTAIYDNPVDSQSFADIVISVLTSRGWHVTPVYIGQQMKHNLKHNYIDLALKGDPQYLFPTFNNTNNEYLIAAMQITGIKVGRNGFEKDKSPEKEPDSPDNPDEYKTHITDAWDTLYIGCNFYAVISTPGASVTHYG